jgi:hypothetical protein
MSHCKKEVPVNSGLLINPQKPDSRLKEKQSMKEL